MSALLNSADGFRLLCYSQKSHFHLFLNYLVFPKVGILLAMLIGRTGEQKGESCHCGVRNTTRVQLISTHNSPGLLSKKWISPCTTSLRKGMMHTCSLCPLRDTEAPGHNSVSGFPGRVLQKCKSRRQCLGGTVQTRKNCPDC